MQNNNIIYLNSSKKYRFIFYSFLLFITCISSFYYLKNFCLIISIILIILSIVAEAYKKNNITSITLPNNINQYFILNINSKDENFWIIKKSIIINSWIYIKFKNETNNQVQNILLHKSNFKNIDDIRNLSRIIYLYHNSLAKT